MTKDVEGNDIAPPDATLDAFNGTYRSEYNAFQMYRYLSQFFTRLDCTLVANGNETILRCTHRRVSPIR